MDIMEKMIETLVSRNEEIVKEKLLLHVRKRRVPIQGHVFQQKAQVLAVLMAIIEFCKSKDEEGNSFSHEFFHLRKLPAKPLNFAKVAGFIE